MSAFVITAVVMLVAMLPLGLTAFRGTLMEAIVAYEGASAVALMVLVLLPEGFGRPGLFEFPIIFAVLLLASGLVFLHAAERWL
jgi:hypothetical protein